MGKVVKPDEAFERCHGYSTDGEIILWSKGVIGIIRDERESRCKKIDLENVPEDEITENNVRIRKVIQGCIDEYEDKDLSEKKFRNKISKCIRMGDR